MAKQILTFRRLALATGILAAVFVTDASVAAEPDASASKSTPDVAAAIEARGYAYESLDFPGSSQTIIWGMDDFGNLAGQYEIAGGTAHAMVYEHGKFKPLKADKLGTYFSAAGGPTDVGTTFGGYADASGIQHGFVVREGKLKTVDFRGHLNSNIDGMDIFGRILGVYWDADGTYHGILSHNGNEVPFDVSGARDTYPLGLNASGDSVGFWDTDGVNAPHGYVRRANGQITTLDVPGALNTTAFGINDFGQISGYFVDATGAVHGFVKSGQKFRQLDMPGALATIPTAINNWGTVAGEYVDTKGARHGFVATLK